jgi:3-phenylpropionate/cinnamic acid dioxygenase small subunit
MHMLDAKVLPNTEVYAEVTDWLLTEAELLDDLREREWLEGMVSRDVVYQVPLRQTVERSRGFGFSETTFHLNERYGSLESRVLRNETQFAWAEDPPSRIRHYVSNIRVRESEDGSLAVRSNLMVYRTRQDQTTPQLLGGERRDVLRREDGRLMLLHRRMMLDLTVIATHNLSIFF